MRDRALRVGIDNISPGESTAPGGPGGMRHYIQTLVRLLPVVGPSAEFTLVTPTWNADFAPSSDRVRVVSLPDVPRSRNGRVLYQQWTLPGHFHRQNLDVLLATATVAPLRLRVPTVLVIQFLQFYDYPETYGRLRTTYLKRLVPASIHRAAKVIVFTEAQRRELLAHVDCDPAKITIVPHGIDQATFSTPADDGAVEEIGTLARGRPFVLYVSATYGYKNHATLIDAFAIFKRRHRSNHVLLFAGSEQGVTFESLRARAASLGCGDDLVCCGRLPSVAAAYQAADVFAFPSLHETFGFPVLEAMVAGCPVVAADRGATAELCGDAAALVDPTNPNAIAAALERVVTDSVYRGTLIRAGRVRGAQFTWERTAALTYAALQQAGQTSRTIA